MRKSQRKHPQQNLAVTKITAPKARHHEHQIQTERPPREPHPKQAGEGHSQVTQTAITPLAPRCTNVTLPVTFDIHSCLSKPIHSHGKRTQLPSLQRPVSGRNK